MRCSVVPVKVWFEIWLKCTMLPMCTVVYMCVCCVSRLQGDSLSDNRSEEEHRPHISEQAVPDISCKLHNTVHVQTYYMFLTSRYIFVVSCSALSFSLIFACVLSGAAPLLGVDTVAGRLQECESMSQVSGSVSVLSPSITKQLRSLYIHQLPCYALFLSLYCLRLSENHLKALINRTKPKQSWSTFTVCVHFSLHNRWPCWTNDTPIRNLPISLCLPLRAPVCNLKRISSDTMTRLEVLYNGPKYLQVTRVYTVWFNRRLAW